jgi:hypothetical protein
VTKRHVQVSDEVVPGIANQVEGRLWTAGGQPGADTATNGLAGEQQLTELLQDDDDETDGTRVTTVSQGRWQPAERSAARLTCPLPARRNHRQIGAET